MSLGKYAYWEQARELLPILVLCNDIASSSSTM